MDTDEEIEIVNVFDDNEDGGNRRGHHYYHHTYDADLPPDAFEALPARRHLHIFHGKSYHGETLVSCANDILLRKHENFLTDKVKDNTAVVYNLRKQGWGSYGVAWAVMKQAEGIMSDRKREGKIFYLFYCYLLLFKQSLLLKYHFLILNLKKNEYKINAARVLHALAGVLQQQAAQEVLQVEEVEVALLLQQAPPGQAPTPTPPLVLILAEPV
jgi:hypothetical protein